MLKRFFDLVSRGSISVFRVTRLLVRSIASIITPILLALSLFSFSISWVLYRCWRWTQPPVSNLTFSEETEDECLGGWTFWGSCMLEASFDTIAALVLLTLMGYFGLNSTTQKQILKPLYDPVLFWSLFWTLNLIPFVIRLRANQRLGMNATY